MLPQAARHLLFTYRWAIGSCNNGLDHRSGISHGWMAVQHVHTTCNAWMAAEPAKHGRRADVKNIDASTLPKVALVGRPNVGKSALFNRLVGRRLALVHDTPESHVTRDWREAQGKLGDLSFTVIDTCGVEPAAAPDTIQGRGTRLTGQLLSHVDLALMVMDARAGLLGPDEELAQWLKRYRPAHTVMLVLNKAESNAAQRRMEQTVADSWRLGFGDPVAVSAATGEGMSDLYAALQPHIDEAVHRMQLLASAEEPGGDVSSTHSQRTLQAQGFGAEEGEMGEGGPGLESASWVRDRDVGVHATQAGSRMLDQDTGDGHEEGQDGSPAHGAKDAVKLAIVGLPNVGKSTLLNQLLGEERVMTGPEPGLTRDPVAASLTHAGHAVQLVDTAGYVGRTKVARFDDAGGEVANKARGAGLATVSSCQVVVLVVDAAHALKTQKVLNGHELTLVSRVIAEGRPLIIAANKMDAIPRQDRGVYVAALREALAERLKDAGMVQVIQMSAAQGVGVARLLPAVLRAHTSWSARVGAGQLNRWLKKDLAAHMTSEGGIARDVKRIKYLAQVIAGPPTIVCFASGTQPIPDHVQSFLASQLRRAFEWDATPVRLWFRYRTAPRAGRLRRRPLRLRQPALRSRASSTGVGARSARTRREKDVKQPSATQLSRKRLRERAEVAAAERGGLKRMPRATRSRIVREGADRETVANTDAGREEATSNTRRRGHVSAALQQAVQGRGRGAE